MLLLFATALALGMLHTVAPDHVAAVAVFVSRRPRWRDAARHGARWGLGHSLTILLVGGLATLTPWRLPTALEPRLEQAVGVMLIALGALAWRRTRAPAPSPAMALAQAAGGVPDAPRLVVPARARRARYAIVPPPSPHDAPASPTTHAADGHVHGEERDGALFGIGMLHGVAGSGALVAALPVATTRSTVEAIGYLVAFGVGTVAAMAALAMALGIAVRTATGRAQRLQATAIRGAAVASMVVGAWWCVAAS
jgi:high-affinity nickel-transport protein